MMGKGLDRGGRFFFLESMGEKDIRGIEEPHRMKE